MNHGLPSGRRQVSAAREVAIPIASNDTFNTADRIYGSAVFLPAEQK